MKPIIILLLFTLAQFVNAQPILNQSNLVPVVGDLFIQYETDTALQPGLSGANQTWTFNNLNFGATHTINYIDVASSPYPNAFPTAAFVEEVGSNYGYYTYDSNFLLNLGTISGGETLAWTPNVPVLCYPLTYLTSCPRSYYTGQYIEDSLSGYIDVNCDGFGTLIINGQIFSNCLRVKSEWHEVIFSPLIGQYNVDQLIYNWVDETHKFPLMSFVTTISSGPINFTIKNVSVASFVTGNNEVHNNLQEFNLFPNPAHKNAFITFDNNIKSDLKIRMLDQIGMEVMKKEIKNNFNFPPIEFDLFNYAQGLYYIEISSKDFFGVKKLLIY
jgi:hypothetical protein